MFALQTIFLHSSVLESFYALLTNETRYLCRREMYKIIKNRKTLPTFKEADAARKN